IEASILGQSPIEKDQVIKLVSDGIASGIVVPLRRAIYEAREAEKAFRFMASGKHIGKIVIKIRDEEPQSVVHPSKLLIRAKPTTIFSPIKSYIIIGGLGGLGLEVLQWMVEKGAKHVITNSRSGVRDNYQKLAISRAESFGAK